ncbi:hypothetical protein [Haploplasma axanthum]|uniref:Lipoprotein n=1 Tax=Haploplasma axanthum TaxID=29552 RepID=A0A449BFG4_HAPAX|nr:hypothetical protein [Haploplasma axanthum]VEU81182.1 Uncharacterised protein [Haploplasma axanthum]
MKVKIFLIINLFLMTFLLFGCEKNKKVNILIVPHQINMKAYSYNTNLKLTFIVNENLKKIDELEVKLSDKSDGSIEEVVLEEYYIQEEYKKFGILILGINMRGVQGDLYIEKVDFNFNGKKSSFDTNVRIQAEVQKQLHIYAGQEGGNVVDYGFTVNGYSQSLKSNMTINADKIYFEGNGTFDLNKYIEEIRIDNSRFINKINIHNGDVFYLEIRVKDTIPKNVILIDQIVFDYEDIESGEKDYGYVMVHLVLSNSTTCAKLLIDSIVGGK